MIKVDYETLSVSGDMTARFKSKDEMFKAVSKYVILQGKDLKKDDRPYIFKGQTK